MPRKRAVAGSLTRPDTANPSTKIIYRPTFSSQLHQERYALQTTGLKTEIDWEALQTTGLKAEIEQLLDVGAWHRLLSIEEPAYRDLMLEFLASFEHCIGYNVWDDPLTIQFQLCGCEYHFSCTDLVFLIGLYTPE